MLIGGKQVGYGHAPIISAELGLAHSGDLALALRMIDEVANAGADSVKLQYFKASDFSDPNSDKTITYKQAFKVNTESQFAGFDQLPVDPMEEITENEYQFFHRHEISLDFVRACHHRAKEHGLIFGVTTTSVEGVREVAGYTDYFKVASDMVSKPEMVEEMNASFEKPMIFSTGHLDVDAFQKFLCMFSGSKERRERLGLVALHCVSEYPAQEPKLWKLTHLQCLGYSAGYSNHSRGIESMVRACELGAVWMETHVTSDPTLPGPDHHWSTTFDELKQLVKAVK